MTLKARCRLIAVASSMVEAMRKLDEQNFDVVMMDNIMPARRGSNGCSSSARSVSSPTSS
jgi:CheY-like chemotaxis protein